MGKDKLRREPSISDDELKQHASDVRYEVETLIYARKTLGWAAGKNRHIALESFLLHFRNVVNFLCVPETAKTDDLFASDFLDQPDPADVGDRAQLVQEPEWTRINRMLMHLSRSRPQYVKDWDAKWPVSEMADRILSGFVTFLKKLSPERRRWFQAGEWFEKEGFASNDLPGRSSSLATTVSDSTVMDFGKG